MSLIREQAKTYIEHLPDIYRGIEEIIQLNIVITDQLDQYYNQAELFELNGIVNTLDLQGVKRWEKILSLNSPINSTLQARKNAILAKYQSHPPINVDTLKKIVEAFLGVEVRIVLHNGDYIVDVRYRGIVELPDLTPLYKNIYELIPANIQVNIVYDYRTWREIMSKTWNEIYTMSWREILMANEEVI